MKSIMTHFSDLTKKRIELIIQWIEPESKILYVGCREGFVAEALKVARKVKVTGIDVSRKAVNVFEERTGFKAYCRDVNNGLGLGSDVYDYIFFI